MKPGLLLLPYTEIYQQAHDAVDTLASEWHVLKVQLDLEDYTSYWSALSIAYDDCVVRKESLLVVEQDIVLNQEALNVIAATDAKVAGCPFWEGHSHNIGLGCLAFSSGFIVANADLIASVGEMAPELEGPAKHWQWLNYRIHVQLLRRGAFQPDNLGVVVQHLHEFNRPDPLFVGK